MSRPDAVRAVFLGTGTSVGIPVITCDCPVCTSSDPRNRRLRASLLLEWERPSTAAPSDSRPVGEEPAQVQVLVDTATDLRQQALEVGLERVDAVLYTHKHADHLLGLDELRIFNFVHEMSIPLYGARETLEGIRSMFPYAFDTDARGVPRLTLNPVDGPFELLGREVVPISVRHGDATVYAFRVGGFAYVTDCSGIPDESAAALQGLEVLVIDALRRRAHPTHFNLEQALREIERLEPERAYLTHLSHEFDHGELERELPEGIGVAHDGLVLEVGRTTGATS